MAFSTEFVMGAGGTTAVEAIPVSMSGDGGSAASPVVYPLATVDAGDRALLFLSGTLVPVATSNTYRPHVAFGGNSHIEALEYLKGPTGWGVGGVYSGTVTVSVLTRRVGNVVTFDGTLYVARL